MIVVGGGVLDVDIVDWGEKSSVECSCMALGSVFVEAVTVGSIKGIVESFGASVSISVEFKVGSVSATSLNEVVRSLVEDC